jgi:CRISPR-associated protein Cst2
MEQRKINCVNIAYIFKTSLGSINGSWTEGNVSTVKKITLPNGQQIPYVSGQSMKYQIRKAWKEMGLGEILSEVKQAEKKAGVDFTAGKPDQYLDDDLLGYMIASKNENRRRTAVVRSSAAIGIFPFRNDRDLGTKSKEEIGGDVSAGGNIFETEIYYNYFKVNFLVELDRLGSFQPFELSKEDKLESNSISIEDKRERLILFFKALENIWGGGKQSRLLTDMSPKFLAITFQTAKSPIFLETLTVSENEELNDKAITEVLKGNNNILANYYLGVQSGIFKNNVSELLNADTIQDTFTNAIEYIKTIDF